MSEFCDRISRLDVVSFDKIIGTAAALIPPDQLPAAKARVSGGIRLLNSESELNDYLVAFGEIHRAKLMEFLPSIPFQDFVDTGLILVDWGCGQEVVSAVTLDYLRSVLFTMRRRICPAGHMAMHIHARIYTPEWRPTRRCCAESPPE